jgi:hypothetical protein
MKAGDDGRRTLERRLSITLRYGTWLACGAIGWGLGWGLFIAPAQGSGTAITAPPQLVTAGIAVLLMLPVLRVTMMAIAFARQRDYLLVGVAMLVLTMIGLGLAVGSR